MYIKHQHEHQQNHSNNHLISIIEMFYTQIGLCFTIIHFFQKTNVTQFIHFRQSIIS